MVSADNVIRWETSVSIFFADGIKWGTVVAAFSDKVTRWEDVGVVVFAAVISRLVVEGGVAEGSGRVVIWEDVFACALLLCFPCHDDSNHGRVAFDASVDVVALQVEVVDEALCGVDDGASARQPIVLVAFCELDDFGSDVVEESLVFRCAE